MSRNTARGFTLLELLVAVTVLTVIVGIVGATFTSVTDSMAIARDSADRLLFRQTLRENLSQNLGAFYCDSACLRAEYALAGGNEDGNLGPADTLRFCTSLPMPGALSLPGVSKSVEYSLIPENEIDTDTTSYPGGDPDRPGMALLMVERPVAADEGLEGAISGADSIPAVQRAVPAASLDVLYLDGDTQEWVEEWDSLSERRLPWAVWVRVNFPRNADDPPADPDSPDLEVMAPLMMGAGTEGPFIDFNRARPGADEMMEEGNAAPQATE